MTELLSEFLACLRMAQLYHQHAHWTTKGVGYYGDHLLFERLYEAATEEIDAFAEKAVGVTGDDHVACPKHVTMLVARKMEEVPCIGTQTSADEIAQIAHTIEKKLVDHVGRLYAEIKQAGTMTMGLDDMLMEICSTHEGHMYLLSQRLKSPIRRMANVIPT